MYYKIIRSSDEELIHHGILGQKWGIRRYQNKDGSLTPEGRKRLDLDAYDRDHGSDTIIKKGTRVNRVISLGDTYEYADPEYGGSPEVFEKYRNEKVQRDAKYERKYISADGVKNSGRQSGKSMYLSWFTDAGLDPDAAVLTEYNTISDIKVASGKQVIDALLKEVGNEKITNMLKSEQQIRQLTLEYTYNKELFNKVNQRFIDAGYDAVEDINDMTSDMPLIVFNSSKTLGEPVVVKNGREAIDELLNNKN